ncbi:MAG: 1-phosphofructokinase [Lachnospiraceae bacterium]|nr:1-phosphofructokinase [Lachnospiraceae bacterium]
MIYTVTFNPAIDFIVHMDRELLPGETNRSTKEEYYIGGKGINVSIILSNLGYESTALGFVGGFTGDAIEQGLKERGIHTDFIRLKEGTSRINVKIKSDVETELNAQGPVIPEPAIHALYDKLDRLVKGDILILAGSIPSSVPPNIYKQILSRLAGRGILSVVDASGELLRNVLCYHPFLVKPNKEELGQLLGKVPGSDQEVQLFARKLLAEGAQNVLVSMASDGAMLLTKTGEYHRIEALKGKVRNSVGAGDSMVAGFIAGYLHTHDYEKALRMGTAAGAATAFSDDLADGETIRRLYATL